MVNGDFQRAISCVHSGRYYRSFGFLLINGWMVSREDYTSLTCESRSWCMRALLTCMFMVASLGFGVRFAPAQTMGASTKTGGTEQRLADLRFLAKEIRTRHPAPYAYTELPRWEGQLLALERGIGTLNNDGFFFRLQEVAALVDDIHTSAFPLADQGLLLETLPIRFRYFGAGIHIRAARRDLAWLLGSRVVAINGLPIERVMKMILRIAPGNQRLRHSNVPLAYLLSPAAYEYLGLSGERGKVSFAVVMRSGEKRNISLSPEPVSLTAAYDSGSVIGWNVPEAWIGFANSAETSTPIYYRRRGQSMVWFEALPGSETLLIQVNQPRPDAANSVVAALAGLYVHLSTNRYRRIVIDLRGNEGGWYSLTSALPGIIASIEAGSEPPAVFVLIGPDTTSAGVALASQLEQQTNAVFVGEPTGSAPNMFGTYKPAQLPNSGIYYRISQNRLINSVPDDDRLWIAPDVAVAERIEDLLRGVDGALEKALSQPLNTGTSSPEKWYERWKRPSQYPARPATQQRKVAEGGPRDAFSLP